MDVGLTGGIATYIMQLAGVSEYLLLPSEATNPKFIIRKAARAARNIITSSPTSLAAFRVAFHCIRLYQLTGISSTRRSLFLRFRRSRAVYNGLHFAVLGLEGTLRVEVELAFSFHSLLLFHVSNHALMHGLEKRKSASMKVGCFTWKTDGLIGFLAVVHQCDDGYRRSGGYR
jgi:hypothetical protein